MFKYIDSKKNRIFIEAKKLNEKKYRDRRGLCLVDGEKLVSECIDEGIVDSLFITEEFTFKIKLDDINTYVLSSELFSKLSPSKSPQGILAICSIPKYSQEMFLSLVKGDRNILLIDRVQDLGNLGNIIRTGYAGHIGGLLLVKGSGDIFSPQVIRSSANTCFKIPYMIVDSDKEAMDILSELNFKLVASDMSGKVEFRDLEIKESICIAVGNEGKGLSREILDRADYVVRIPMQEGLESLNVSVATALLIYHFM